MIQDQAMIEAPAAPIGHNRPPKARPSFARVCPECGAEFKTENADRSFCSTEHQQAFHNRSSKIGRSLVPLAQAWRLGRNAKGQSPKAKALRASAARAFAEMCALIDAANSEDLAKGRQNKLTYVRARNRRDGTLAKAETIKFHEAEAAKAVQS